MKEITVKVTEDRYQFFLELLEQLDFVEVSGAYEVPEFHKAIVRERKEVYKTEKQHNWDEVKDKFDLLVV